MSEPQTCATRAGGTLLVVSSHGDDGVRGCGALIHAYPGARVVTVFAGSRERYGTPSVGRRSAGSASGEDLIAARGAVDRAARATIGATPYRRSFRDPPAGPSLAADVVVHDLAALLVAADPRCVALPLGIFDADRAFVHRVSLRVVGADPAWRTRTWLAYADALCRRVPGLVAERLATLAEGGVCATPWPACAADSSPPSHGRPGCEDTILPERYWQLAIAARPCAAGE